MALTRGSINQKFLESHFESIKLIEDIYEKQLLFAMDQMQTPSTSLHRLLPKSTSASRIYGHDFSCLFLVIILVNKSSPIFSKVKRFYLFFRDEKSSLVFCKVSNQSTCPNSPLVKRTLGFLMNKARHLNRVRLNKITLPELN